MKKILTIVLLTSFIINLFSLFGYAENTYKSEITASDFFELVQNFTNKHIGNDALAGGTGFPSQINRLIVKTFTNAPLENTYDAIDVLEGYECLHILQFDSSAKADAAYDLLVNCDTVEYVDYDFWIELDTDALTNRLLACFCPEDTILKPGCQCPSNTNNYYFCSKEDETAPEGHLSWVTSTVMVDEAFELIENSDVVLNSVDVAVFDTGVYSEHSEFLTNNNGLTSRIKIDDNYSLKDTNKDGTITNYPSDVDDFFHGTHVAGILHDNTMDIINIYSYRIFKNDYNKIPYLDFAAALDMAIKSGMDIINMSVKDTYDASEQNYLNAVFDLAVANGVVIVAAAGNDCGDVNNLFPASYENAITVSATEKNNKPDKTYTNYGDCVDVAAPGTDVYSSVPRNPINNNNYDPNDYPATNLYMRLSGTSQAAPLVSAAAALIKSIDPDITPAEVERIIKETAYVPDDWEESCGGENYGTGIVNFYNIAKAMLGEGESQTPEIKITSDNKFEISVPDGSDARFYYTLDGSMPTLENHLTYSEPLSLINTYSTGINVVCHENGKLISEPVTYDMITYKTKTIFYKSTGTLKSNAGCKNAYWSSYNSDIAQVDNQGNITANSVGNTKITCLLQTGERIIWKVNVIYNPIQAFFVLFFFGFLWI